MVAGGALLSGYFIVTTDAWMQHPVGHTIGPDGRAQLTSLWALLTNPYAGWQYWHTINGALVTGAFVVAGIGAYYMLIGRHTDFAKVCLKVGVICGAIFALIQAMPTGNRNAENVSRYQPTKTAAMEGLFNTQKGAPIAIIGMPDTDKRELLDPIYVPKMLSFLAYGNFDAPVKGLNEWDEADWPPVELVYYAYHIMVGLGTIFIGVAFIALFLLWRRQLYSTRLALWVLMLITPFPYIANQAGWVVAEVGRQPWVIYGLMRTQEGVSMNVSGGETTFTLLGFMGLYALLGLLYLFLFVRLIGDGPDDGTRPEGGVPVPATGGAELEVAP
jgi:cytochrome d ubiquinol oxidase subunit I